jgi:predicted dehydrogenase
LPCLQALSDSYTLTAAATSRKESADQVAATYDIKTFSGPDAAAQLAKDQDVEMVVIALKTPLHKPVALEVLDARKPTYLEWPLGNGLQEALELGEAAKKAGVRTIIGLQARQDPAIRKAKELLEQGKIGTVLSSNCIGYAGSWGAQVPARDAYTLDASNGATITSIPFGHFVDSLVYLLGLPLRVRGDPTTWDGGGRDGEDRTRDSGGPVDRAGAVGVGRVGRGAL